MTCCIGWKTATNAYLVADSAVSFDGRRDTTKSSFGELHEFDVRAGRTLSERALKIVRIGCSTAVAIAGDFAAANDAAAAVRSQLRSGLPPLEALQKGASDVHNKEGKHFAIILAHVSDEGPILASYDTRFGTAAAEHAFMVHKGSLSDYHPSLTEALLKMFIGKGLSDERQLPLVASLLQCYGILAVMARQHVGGAFCGIRITKDKASWLEDTSYLLYRDGPPFEVRGFITVVSRGDALIVGSSITNDTRVFVNTVMCDNYHAWRKTWVPKIPLILNSGRCKYWVFLSTSRHAMAIFEADYRTKTKDMQIIPPVDGKWDFLLSSKLIRLLCQKGKRPDGVSDDALPLTFTWLSGAKDPSSE